MDNHTFLGKRCIGITDICDFTDYQGLGHDPLYKRYDSVFSIIKRAISPKYVHFLATPDYSPEEDVIKWYVPEWNETPEPYFSLKGDRKVHYQAIKEDTLKHYRDALQTLSGEDLQVMAGALCYIDDDFIYCCDDKVYVVAWGMTPDKTKHIPKGELVHESPCITKYTLTFDATPHGKLSSKLGEKINLPEGTEIIATDLPEVNSEEGYVFKGWIPNPIGMKVTGDLNFKASYDAVVTPPEPPRVNIPQIPEPPKTATCKFDAGSRGSLKGNSSIIKTLGSRIQPSEIPTVLPMKGYIFKGWDINPANFLVSGDVVFHAMYEEKLPWYKRWWGWFTGKGCLKWILWLLLGILIIMLCSWLFNGCHGCRREINGVAGMEKIVTATGDTVDNNGRICPIQLHDGHLPKEPSIVAPIRDENGSLPPIVREPGVPPVFGNRLFLFLENDNDQIDGFADAFKKAYPGNQYSIIGYDREVKSLLIQIPANERDEIRQTINSKIPNYQFIVFDEEIYELNGHFSTTSTSSPGWHLSAVNAQEGWKITKGSPSVVIAVVDDGIDASHPIFKDRIEKAYNVFTQNNRLSCGEGHGTHTAGVAVGSHQFIGQGAAGIAPDCKLMPVQVFDNGMCPLSALVSGILYAVHNGADVVNVSIGPSFAGLNQLPLDLQEDIARTKFVNVAALWNRVCKLASDRNTILVFAAGNDDIISSIPPENRTSVALTVGAVDQKLYPTDFTNYGPDTDISAPGKEIYSSFPSNRFMSCDGTSMAAPIVSGAIALMKTLKKDLTVKQAYNVLYRTGKDVYGNMPPMLQINLALEAVERGDFSEPARRALRPVPGGVNPDNRGDIPSSWTDIGRMPGSDTDNSAVTIISDLGDRENAAPGVNANSEGDDYEAIRRLIAEYKQKISELEGQLPENKR